MSSQADTHTSTRQSQPSRQAAANAGSMTVVMRSVSETRHAKTAAAKHKLLRVAVVRSGAIVEERLVKNRGDVTIGESERATFAIAHAALPPAFKLFERARGAYHLNLLDAMSGRIALDCGITEVRELSRRGQRSVALSESARGKIVLGATTLVFQFVDAPVVAKPQLPISIRTGLGIDWNLTFIAALSFLAHFGIAGAMYTDLVDPVVDQDVTASLVDELKHVHASSTPIETRPSETDSQTASTNDTQTASPKPKPSPDRSHGQPTPGTTPPRGVTAAEVRNVFGDLVSVLTPGKTASDVLRDDKVWVPFPGTSSNHPGDDPGIGPSATTYRPHEESNPLVPRVSPLETKPLDTKAPEIKFSFQAPLPPAPQDVPDLQSVLSRIAPQARACYQQGLARNPSQQGKVTIVARIGPSGDVESVSIQNQGLDAGTASCIAGRVRAAHFKSGGANGTTVGIPFIFVQQ